jgi:hypothetical protein
MTYWSQKDVLEKHDPKEFDNHIVDGFELGMQGGVFIVMYDDYFHKKKIACYISDEILSSLTLNAIRSDNRIRIVGENMNVIADASYNGSEEASKKQREYYIVKGLFCYDMTYVDVIRALKWPSQRFSASV